MLKGCYTDDIVRKIFHSEVTDNKLYMFFFFFNFYLTYLYVSLHLYIVVVGYGSKGGNLPG